MNGLTRLSFLCVLLLALLLITGCNKSKEENDNSTNDAPITLKKISDTELSFNVKVALLSDKNISRFDIKVKTKKGVVRLTGVVDNQDQIDYVEKLVRNIGGVQGLHDELTFDTRS